MNKYFPVVGDLVVFNKVHPFPTSLIDGKLYRVRYIGPSGDFIHVVDPFCGEDSKVAYLKEITPVGWKRQP